MKTFIERYWQALPNFDWSNLLLRIPLAVVFLQQGMSKLPFSADMAAGFGLSNPVWWFVIIGEIAAGAGLLAGGVMSLDRLRDFPLVAALGDMLTRFSGIVMCSIATGVIWTTKPESLWSVILYDNLHVFLWVGGLYFALRGNWAVAIEQKIDTHP
jgi:putative oxidoreductase